MSKSPSGRRARPPGLLTTGLWAVMLATNLVGQPCAETYVVHPDGSGDHPTIQAGIDAADGGDVIELTDGTFTGTGNLDVEFRGKPVTVRSASGDPSTCIIDCDSPDRWYRGFFFHESEGPGSVLEGLTITGGIAWGPVTPWQMGGAILCAGASPEIRNCIFRGNMSYNPEPYSIGGAIASVNDGSPSVIGCGFFDNMSNHGGALFGAFSVIEECTFVGNLALAEWGGAAYGGAIALEYQDAVIRNCTVVYNEADVGAALAIWECSPNIENTLLAFNGPDAAVYLDAATLSLSCCDLFGNGGGDWTVEIADQLGINGNISLDPLLCWSDPETTTEWTLHSDSPCAPPQSECGLIGAWGVGCGSSPIQDCTWGTLKTLFRPPAR